MIAQELMASLVTDGLDEGDRDRLEDHLASCASCRQDLDAMVAVTDLVHRSAANPQADTANVFPPTLTSTRRLARGLVRRPAHLVAALAAVVALAASIALATATTGPSPAAIVPVAAAQPHQTSGTATLDELDTGVGVHLDLSGLHDPGAGTYETWLSTADGASISIGTFEPAGDGTASIRLHGVGDLDHYFGLVVTAEPNRADPARNGPAVAIATFATT